MKYDEDISSLGLHLREFLLAQLDGCIEIPDLSANMVAYGYGSGYIDMICTIIPSKKGIKLGFYKGSELPDPENLLTGSGKVHRYVEIKSEKDIRSRAIKQLVKEAIKSWKTRKQTKALSADRVRQSYGGGARLPKAGF
jgi:hypothetical protein